MPGHRHVRVHHPDKGIDDIELRLVLSQRLDGSVRSRQRRSASYGDQTQQYGQDEYVYGQSQYGGTTDGHASADGQQQPQYDWQHG